jgi:hypothetical protein
MRHVVGEAAWSYRHRPAMGPAIKKRREDQSEDVKAIAWKAQHRLHQRFQKLSATGKHHGRVITAISRELLGFVWAIGRKIEAELDGAHSGNSRNSQNNEPSSQRSNHPRGEPSIDPRGEPSIDLCGTPRPNPRP